MVQRMTEKLHVNEKAPVIKGERKNKASHARFLANFVDFSLEMVY
jgi:hypothetical protein